MAKTRSTSRRLQELAASREKKTAGPGPTDSSQHRRTSRRIRNLIPAYHANPGASPLLSIPAELRNLIYTLVFASSPPLSLAKFKEPPLTQVSKQIRSESLGLFFAKTHFIVEVNSNWEDCCRAIWWFQNYRSGEGFTPSRCAPGLGRLIPSRQIENDPGVVFNNITFRTVSHKWWWRKTEAAGEWRMECGGSTVLEAEFRSLFLCVSGEWVARKEAAVDATIDRVQHAANVFAAREGFDGFTLRELRVLARKFKWMASMLQEVARTGSAQSGGMLFRGVR